MADVGIPPVGFVGVGVGCGNVAVVFVLAAATWELGVIAVHALVAAMMAGLIWTMQVVHYPLFARISAADAETYQRDHMRRITQLVGPLMVVQGVLVWVLFLAPPDGVERWLVTASGLAQALALGWTAAYFAPLHGRLADEGYSAAAVRRLVQANWIRTIAWTTSAATAVAIAFTVD